MLMKKETKPLNQTSAQGSFWFLRAPPQHGQLVGNAFCGLRAGFSTEPVASLAMSRLRVYYSRAQRIPNFNLLAILVTQVRRERLGRHMPELVTEEPLISYGPQG